MADGTASTRDVAGGKAEKRPHLRLVAGTEVPEKMVAVRAPSAPLRPLLSPSQDLFGVSPASWIAAALLFALLLAGLWLKDWTVTPPEPWQETPTTFRIIFAPPPPEPAPPTAEPAPPAQAAPETPSPPPEPAVPPPESEAAAPAPIVPPPEPPPAPAPPRLEEPALPLPLPPPPKPAPPALHPHRAPLLPRAQALRTDPAPRAAPPVAAPAVPALAPAAAAEPLLPPRPISGVAANPKPVYPVEARSRHQQGRVLLRVEVSAAGMPLSVTVARSSSHPALDEAALAAVRRWRFSPATRGGVPVAGTAEVPVEFRLEE